MAINYPRLKKTTGKINNIAFQEKVDFTGMSIHSGAHISLIQTLFDGLKKKKIENVLVLIGGVIH